MSRWCLLSLAALCGCTRNHMVGAIDGLQWPVGEAYFVVDEGAYGEDGLLAINLSSLPDACRVWQMWDVAVEDAESAEDLADGWKETFPKVFWEVHIGARIRPNGWPVARTGWPGVPWDEYPGKPDVVYAEFIEHKNLRDAAWFEAEATLKGAAEGELTEDEIDELQDTLSDAETVYRSHAGAIKWRSSTPDRIAKGHFATSVVDEKGKNKGRVDAFFNSTPCNTEPPLDVEPPEESEPTSEEEEA